jgi:hypothetical protein
MDSDALVSYLAFRSNFDDFRVLVRFFCNSI